MSLLSGASSGNILIHICFLSILSGNGNSTINCILLKNASSIFLLRFVASITTPSYSSIFCNKYPVSILAYLSWASFTSERFPKRASASSKNRIALLVSASLKILLRFFSVSPIYLLITLERSIL